MADLITIYLIYWLGAYFAAVQAHREHRDGKSVCLSALLWPITTPFAIIERFFK